MIDELHCNYPIFPFSWSFRSIVDIMDKSNTNRVIKDNSDDVQIVGGSVYIKSANRLTHEGEWTCNVHNSLGSEKQKLKLIVTGNKIKSILCLLNSFPI